MQPLIDGGRVSSTFDANHQVRLFSFSAVAGHEIFITLVGGPAMCYNLNGPGGIQVATSCQLGNYYSLRRDAPSTGEYVLSVQSFSGMAVGQFAVNYMKAPSNEESVRLGDTPIFGALGVGEMARYHFDAIAGTRLFYSNQFTSTSGSTIYFVDPTGALLEASWIPHERVATMSGRYYVIIGPSQSPMTYLLNSASIPGSNECGLISSSGGGVNETLTPMDLDTFTFRASAGSPAQLVASGSLPVFMDVYSPSGVLVARNFNLAQTLNIAALPVSGVYTLRVTGPSFPSFGSYQISLVTPSFAPSYAALGDSYSSGEGVFPFLGTSVGFFSGCNRSSLAYSRSVRAPYSVSPIASDLAADFDFYACTGATTENIRVGGESRFGEPPQALSVQSSERDLITLSIGGNDTHFAWILGYCLATDDCANASPLPGIPLALRDVFPFLVALTHQKLVATFSELRANSPNAAILALDYPIVIGENECMLTKLPGAPNLSISSDERSWMREANVLVNQAVASAASIAGVHLVSVQDHFNGHGVCGVLDDWIFGTYHIWPKGIFHPNARGQYEIGKVVNQYIDSKRILWPHGYNRAGFPRNPPPVAPTGPFAGLSVPPGIQLPTVEGDLVVSVLAAPAGCQVSRAVTAVPNSALQLSGSGFIPNSTLTIDLVAPNQSILLSQIVADSSGGAFGTIILPANVPLTDLGFLRISGAGSQGEFKILTAALRVRGNFGNDSDGDGINSACDNCQNIPNSQQIDSDADGIGDSCDLCPFEAVNDEDGDGTCAPSDICPQDPLNDSDGDGVCDNFDNCPQIPNATQIDVNGDSVGDVCAGVSCLPLKLLVRGSNLGEVTVTPGGCPNGDYFEGQLVRARAIPNRGARFAGWGGAVTGTSSIVVFNMGTNTTLGAAFVP
jgi:hypothetical protein